MKNWNIKKRLILMILLPTFITAFFLISYFVTLRFQDLEENMLMQGKSMAMQLGQASRYALLTNNTERLTELTRIAIADTHVNSIAIFNKEKQLLAYNGLDSHYLSSEKDLQFLQTEDQAVIHHGNVVDFILPITMDTPRLFEPSTHSLAQARKQAATIGWIAINFSYTDIAIKKYQTIIATSATVLLGLALSILSALHFSQYLLSPIRKIAEAVKKLQAGQLDTHIAISNQDELGSLAGGINVMAETLKSMRTELQENIDQATCDLRETLETLESQNIELNIAQKEAQEASRIKSEFIANMSHDIRTPMNCIIGFTQLLSDSELNTTQRDFVSIIQQSSENLLALINNVLDFSKLEAGKLRLEQVPLDLRDCVEDVLRIHAPRAHTKQLELTHIIYDDVPKNIISDPLRIKQILTNLISNAIKFTEQGSVIVRVSLEHESTKEAEITISVTDTGIGLSEEQQSSAFDTFKKGGEKNEKFTGAGLGIAITKRLVELMHGKIGVKSELNKGSTFWVSITCQKIHGKKDGRETPLIFSNQRIWLHEQHPITRYSTVNQLKKWKLHIEETSNSHQVEQCILDPEKGEDYYQLIILGMHQTSNFEEFNTNLLSKIKERFSCPIIVLSNSREPHLLEQLTNSGAALCLPKPVLHADFPDALQKLLLHDDNQTTLLTLDKNSHLSLKNITILSVDDNPHNNNLVKTLLERDGAKVTTAVDGYYAIILANKQDFDVILMDLRMPNIDGIQATKLIRRPTCRNYKKPIIAVSAHITANEKTSLLEAGFTDYIVKPIDEDQIRSAILKYLKDSYTYIPYDKKPEATPVQHVNNEHVDLVFGIKLAGGKKQLAIEMLEMLAESMVTEVADIQKAYTARNFTKLYELVHRLHGAVCYAGTPRLKQLIEELETRLKNKDTAVDELFSTFITETSTVQDEIAKLMGDKICEA